MSAGQNVPEVMIMTSDGGKPDSNDGGGITTQVCMQMHTCAHVQSYEC